LTRTDFRQPGQANCIGEVLAADRGAPFHFAPEGWLATGDLVGIVITALQCGHLPFFPVFAAGTRSVFWQLAQTNWMGSLLAG
jgi:hypothetical protein